MQEQSYRKLIFKWLKGRKNSIILFLLIMITYIVVAKLMQLKLDAIWYSTFLTCVILGLVGIWDCRKSIYQYNALLNTYKNRIYDLKFMPESDTFIEEGYQEIIVALHEDLINLKNEIQMHRQETDDYYTTWTHQIKTPIAAMHLILQNQKCDENVQRQKERLLLEGELFKIEQYTQMALQYLRVESMSEDLELKQYTLYPIVANALKKHAVSFMGKKLSIHIEPFEASVVTDKKWLQFVLEQIISNSIKYTHEGGITIQMRDEKTLEISDTGIGIRSEDIPRIFTRGFTGYNGRMDKKSSGIGLYLCKKITDQLSHKLEVKSTLGEGTCFYIHFETFEGI